MMKRRATVLSATFLIGALFGLLLYRTPALAQKQRLQRYTLSTVPDQPLLPDNSISQLASLSNELWLGTGKGLVKSINNGRSWVSYGDNLAFANNGIFALAIRGSAVWVSTGFDENTGSNGTVQTGSGYAYSFDDGATWHHVSQTLDARGDSIVSYGINDSLWLLPVVVPEQNVTFDISLTPKTIWIASWASGLRKSIDSGATWTRIILPPDVRNSINPTDTLWSTVGGKRIFQRFDPRANNNMLAFSVHAVDDDTIWCGTAGGVNKSTDSGKSWIRFTHQNQALPILGNWVIAVNEQILGSTHRIWTTNWKADEASEDYGISYTDNGGLTWTNLLRGVKAYDFAFKDSIVYIASDDGLYRSADGGKTFSVYSTFVAPASRDIISGAKVFTVHVIEDTVYAGTADGLVSTEDSPSHAFGTTWQLYRSYQQTGIAASTYAYPNPFAPTREITRIHYGASTRTTPRSVSIDIFDFGMNRVRTLIHDASRDPSREYDEIWDGRADDGTIIANGVYIYRVKIDNDDPFFGKILVLQ